MPGAIKEIHFGFRTREEQLERQMGGAAILIFEVEHGLPQKTYKHLSREKALKTITTRLPHDPFKREQLVEHIAQFGEGFRIFIEDYSHFRKPESRNRMLLILGLRTGLLGEPNEPLSEVGKYFGIHYERVRQIEFESFSLMRWYAQTPQGLAQWQAVRESAGIIPKDAPLSRRK